MSNWHDGLLMKNDIGRWSIGENDEITSGEIIEVNVSDNWITTRIEHDGTGYYAVVPGVQLYSGMKARRLK